MKNDGTRNIEIDDKTSNHIKYMVDLCRTLSLDYEKQYEKMEDFARWNLPDETGLEWIDAKGIIYSEELKSVISDEAIQILDTILRNFEEAFDDPGKNEVWTHEAMKGHEFWDQQRALAVSF